MAEAVHKSDTLGKKHEEYNKLLKETLLQGTSELKDLSFDAVDIGNLLQIDIACHNKNIEYLLKVLKSEDFLYVSRAIQNSTWLITDKQYANIINPDYLHNNLFPEMTTKAYIKLKKSIIHNLTDESRVEYFYNKEKCPKTAIKWLLNCSVPFIEENIEKHCNDLKPRTIKRFCEKSVSIFEILAKLRSDQTLLSAAMILFYKHTDIFLNAMESTSVYNCLAFNSRATEWIMKKFPERILNNFYIYVSKINIETFVKYLKKENIKSFLYKQVQDYFNNSNYRLGVLFNSDVFLLIIKQMPKEEQYPFVKEVFIDKIHNNENMPIPFESELCRKKELCETINLPLHVWYQFAPFEVAFEEIKKLIFYETCQETKNSMLLTLIISTKGNLQYIQTLFKYYKNEHNNVDSSSKIVFIYNLMNNENINRWDKQTWDLLNEIFCSMNAYEESDEESNEQCQNYYIAIILYKVINTEVVPEIIEKKFHFNTLESYCKALNKENKKSIFNYLLNYLLKNINALSITNESDFKVAVELVKNYLNLLLVWKKELPDHPFILVQIRKLIELKHVYSWKFDLSPLYNIKKSWKKYMFNESLALCQSEKVIINALKHDPSLLDRYKTEVDSIRFNDQLSNQQLTSKIRIYWPQTLAIDWVNTFLERLNVLEDHKAVIQGLCRLLSQKQFTEIIKKYAPQQDKIKWSEIDELTLSLQRHIAKNMHYARPQPSGDAVLLYARGDYLNYALPSLLAIFYNINLNHSRKMITKLLDCRVSLQKHIIRFAFKKLEHDELIKVLSIIWGNSKNATIRCIIFNNTFNLLRNQKEEVIIKLYSELLEMFIENLTSEEDKKVYEIFEKVNEIPLMVRANILMKSYKLFQRLVPNKTNDKEYFDKIINILATYTRSVMDVISSDFVTEIVQNYLSEKFLAKDEYVQSSYGMVQVVSAYFLSAKDIESQIERYVNVLKPLIRRCLNSWNEIHEETYFIKNRFQSLLTSLRHDLENYKEKINFAIIHNLFSNILLELNSLIVSENYIILTSWKLTVALAKLLSNVDVNNSWQQISLNSAAEFGKICLEHMKTDVQTHFSCIYVLFVKALNKVTEDLFSEHGKLLIYESMLSDKEFMQAYLGVISVFPQYIPEESETLANNIKKHLTTYPSVEVKMHYYNKFS